MSTCTIAIFTAALLALPSGKAFDWGSYITLPNLSDLGSILPPLNADLLEDVLPIDDPELANVNLDFAQIAAKNGHPAEEYIIYTEDGYRLKVFHLPGQEYGGLPVLLFHGFVDSSDTWMIRGAESLSIWLANAGYDVWLGNVRGNKHSQGHLSLSVDLNSTYWDFTFHEHAVYDLPATIDLVLNETGAPMLNSIGHSQGTTIHFVLLSTRPEYNEKVNMLIALAPVAHLQHSPPPLSVLLRAAPTIYQALYALAQYDLLGDTSPEDIALRQLCNTPLSAYSICLTGLLFQLTGYDPSQIDPAFSLVVFKHFPTASSTKNFLHYGQVTIRKLFAWFDYGPERNLELYNSTEPPVYDLTKVKSKVVLVTGTNDFFSTQPDVAILRSYLPNVVRYVVNPKPNMNHLDYVWGKDMKEYLFPIILNSLEDFTDS